MKGSANRSALMNTSKMLKMIISTSIQVTNMPLLAIELSKLYLSFAPMLGLVMVGFTGSPCEPWPYERSSVLLVIVPNISESVPNCGGRCSPEGIS